MGEYKPDVGLLDALRAHVEAIRTEAARVGTGALRAAALDARERLAHRPEPLPERIAALDLQVAAKLKELEETLRGPTEPRPAGDSACDMAWAIAVGCFRMAEEASDTETSDFYLGQGYHYLGVALECEEGGSAIG